MHYTIENHRFRHYKVYNEQHDSPGTLTLKTWWLNKGEINTVNGQTYKITPTGFWQTTMAITKDEIPFAEIKALPFKGLRLSFAAENRAYFFKRNGVWNSNYTIMDEEGHEIAAIQIGYNWRELKFSYEVDVYANMRDKEADLVLPLLLVLGAVYDRMRKSAAV